MCIYALYPDEWAFSIYFKSTAVSTFPMYMGGGGGGLHSHPHTGRLPIIAIKVTLHSRTLCYSLQALCMYGFTLLQYIFVGKVTVSLAC